MCLSGVGEVGEEVAWRTGEGDNQTIKAKFVIMPPASLLNMAAKPGGLEEFDTIILDEAHILSLEIEVILRYMRYVSSTSWDDAFGSSGPTRMPPKRKLISSSLVIGTGCHEGIQLSAYPHVCHSSIG